MVEEREGDGLGEPVKMRSGEAVVPEVELVTVLLKRGIGLPSLRCCVVVDVLAPERLVAGQLSNASTEELAEVDEDDALAPPPCTSRPQLFKRSLDSSSSSLPLPSKLERAL